MLGLKWRSVDLKNDLLYIRGSTVYDEDNKIRKKNDESKNKEGEKSMIKLFKKMTAVTMAIAATITIYTVPSPALNTATLSVVFVASSSLVGCFVDSLVGF